MRAPQTFPMRPAWRSAFTLIELLIVVAIIAVIAAMLMPAIAQAQSMARSAACMAHLRQLGMVMELYSQDWEDRMVWSGAKSVAAGGDGRGNWYQRLGPYLGARASISGTSSTDADVRRVRTVLGGCPAWNRSRAQTELVPLIGAGFSTNLGFGINRNLDRPNSYAMNHYPGDGAPAPFREFTFASITYPSQRLLVSDWYDAYVNGNLPLTVFQTVSATARHRGRGNVLFCDLHAATTAPDQAKFAVANPALVQ